MLYYKVKPEYNQKYKNPKIHDCNVYIGGELYTLREVEKQGLNLDYLEPVEIPRTSIYYSFGARFSMP